MHNGVTYLQIGETKHKQLFHLWTDQTNRLASS